MFPTALLDADDDWQESFRRYWFPKLHPFLSSIGGYGVSTSSKDQYVGYVDVDEDVIEEELVAVGFRRNPVAAYKSSPDDRQSEGSWVLLAEDDVGSFIPDGYQLHVTLYECRDGESGREFYAHVEPDWRRTPFRHLYPGRFDDAKYIEGPAATYTKTVLDDHAFFVVKDEKPAR